jgi:N-acetyl-gamma-glutamyl-phosphate reductase
LALGNGVQTAVAGVRGYAGEELARLLLAHPRLAGTTPVFAGREPGTLSAMHPRLQPRAGETSPKVETFSWELLRDKGVKILFLATPHEQSREWAPIALQRGIRVIDLSGAWRLNVAANRAVYKFSDEGTAQAQATAARAVYGMSELHKDAIAAADLVANPGCYATSMILALKPLLAAGLLDREHGIICDAKSGVSGAGREPTPKTHFMYAADNLSAYGLFAHRHTGELLEQLELEDEEIIFTPHLLPIPRGILSTIYVRSAEKTTRQAIAECYRSFYEGRPMVRLFPAGELPQIAYVTRTSFCDIGFELARDERRCILVSCLDNLLKGAASQAVQNMNLMLGWNEAEGLL